VILNENSSAIDQITNALADQKDIEAVHIVSHGSEGSLKLGADVLNENNLETFSNQAKTVGKCPDSQWRYPTLWLQYSSRRNWQEICQAIERTHWRRCSSFQQLNGFCGTRRRLEFGIQHRKN
jgi:hypothetical protein